MIYHKEAFNVTITAGTGAANTGRLYGRIEQLLCIPQNSSGGIVASAVWNLSVTDKDGDRVNYAEEHTGALDDRTALPIGRDITEIWTFSFTSVTGSPDRMRIVLKVYEK